VWKTWAPAKCNFFMWLVEHDRCWTADKLAKRGMDHPEQCPLCDQHDESINHLLASCVFARQLWDGLLSAAGLQHLVPQPYEMSFEDWWQISSQWLVGQVRSGFNSMVILGAWVLWKHRNGCVFGGLQPSVQGALHIAREEALLWTMAGAKGLSLLQSVAVAR
jgi:hypothetical protein